MKKRFSMSMVGISSLLVIFAVLCLTVFALLSVSTVQAQLRLAQGRCNAVIGYYAADCQAEELLAQLRSGRCPEGVFLKDGIYAYACPISETQTLAVQVKINGSDYTVLQWQAVPTAQWDAENRLPVWNGQEP